MNRHGSQVRDSGAPYFSHPLEVAGILANYRLDSATIATGLLHDTIEDGVASASEIHELFGSEVAILVDGVTKLSKIRRGTAPGRGNDLRKFVLAMTEDIRVLFVKLADRLHNMRTLSHIRKPERRRRIAEETLDIYAPLARRVGIIEICEELEDLAFAEIHPEAHESVRKRVAFLHESAPRQMERTEMALRKMLEKAGIKAEVSGREKRPYSIWRKMKRKQISVGGVNDFHAFRVVVKELFDCYRILGAIHETWRFVPGRFKDHISVPKPNGYRSLHTAVIGPHNHRIEVQIRTEEMHQIAERGLAAHWLYKDRGSGPAALHEAGQWLRGLREIFEGAADHEEGLEDTKLEMYSDLVFCFTPDGDVISLPYNATPVDFAYAVHTRIGETCVGCTVNGVAAPLNTSLANGDQVEILRSRGQKPQSNWESFVRTGRARSHIRRFLRAERRKEFAKLGQRIVEKAFEEAGHPFTPKALDPALRQLGFRSRKGLFVSVGSGEFASTPVLQAVHPDARRPRARAQRKGQAVEGASVGIRGLVPGVAVHLAECCSPLPGERIVGILIEGKGASVHTIDCESLERFVAEPERWLDLKWAEEAVGQVARMRARVTNKPGSLNALAEGIAGTGANVTNLRILRRSVDVFELEVGIEVEDVRHFRDILTVLHARPEIFDVERIRD